MADGQLTTVDAREIAPADYGNDNLTFAQRVALDPTVNIDRLEKIIQMERDSQRHEAERAFNVALSDMQPELPAVQANGRGDKQAKYGKLEDIQAAIKPVLQKHGFAVRFKVHDGENSLAVECILSHKAGHSDSDRISLPYDKTGSKNDVQARGSTVSYGKRYTLCNILNIQVGGEDNDGAGDPQETIGPDQMTELDDLLKRSKSDRAKFFAHIKVEGMADITVKQFPAVKKLLERKLKDASQ
jgi:hypothetical protein